VAKLLIKKFLFELKRIGKLKKEEKVLFL